MMSRIMGNSCRQIEGMYAGWVVKGPFHAFEAEHDCLRGGTDLGDVLI